MSDIQKCIELLESWQKNAWSLLVETFNYPAELVEFLIKDYTEDSSKYDVAVDLPYNLSLPIYSAIRGLSFTRSLIATLQKPAPADITTTQFIGQIASIAFEAGLGIGMFAPAQAKECYKELHETKGIKAVSKRATDERYLAGRELYKEACEIVRNEWNNGSTKDHRIMKNYLTREYENGKSRFSKFDKKCGYTEGGLLKQLKDLAKEMNRPDLIAGAGKKI